MADEETPFKDNFDDSRSQDEFDEELDEMHKVMEKRDKTFKKLTKFERKLMKGFMRGFANTMILWLISKKRQHGYEIMTKLHESSPYESKMPSASKIYPVLHDLEKHGLIKGTWEYQGKRKVKYYEITKEGEETLSRFRKMGQFARKHKSNLWLEFMRDIMSIEIIETKRS